MLRSVVKWEIRRDKDRRGKKVLMKKVTLTCLWNTCYSLASQSDASILFLISTRSKIVIYRLLISQAEALLNCLGSLLCGEIDYPLYLFSLPSPPLTASYVLPYFLHFPFGPPATLHRLMVEPGQCQPSFP